MSINTNKQKFDLSAKRSTSRSHYPLRCTLTPTLIPNFLLGFKLFYVSRYLHVNNTSKPNLDTANLRIDLP